MKSESEGFQLLINAMSIGERLHLRDMRLSLFSASYCSCCMEPLADTLANS